MIDDLECAVAYRLFFVGKLPQGVNVMYCRQIVTQISWKVTCTLSLAIAMTLVFFRHHQQYRVLVALRHFDGNSGITVSENDCDMFGIAYRLGGRWHDYCQRPYQIVVDKTVTDAALAKLRELAYLPSLILVDVPAEVVVRLSGLPIERLDVNSNRLTEGTIAAISQFPGVADITLRSANEIPSLSVLGNAKSLKRLTIYKGVLANESESFASMQSLRSLRLTDCTIGDKCFHGICRLLKLRCLVLRGSDVANASLAGLKSSSQLEELDLAQTSVNNDFGVTLGQLTSLKAIFLGETHVTDRLLAAVVHLRKLEKIELSCLEDPVSASTVLKGLPNLQEIIFAVDSHETARNAEILAYALPNHVVLTWVPNENHKWPSIPRRGSRGEVLGGLDFHQMPLNCKSVSILPTLRLSVHPNISFRDFSNIRLFVYDASGRFLKAYDSSDGWSVDFSPSEIAGMTSGRPVSLRIGYEFEGYFLLGPSEPLTFLAAN